MAVISTSPSGLPLGLVIQNPGAAVAAPGVEAQQPEHHAAAFAELG